ncbi:unnamed protein product [Musa hybrid cultivar]
MSSSHQNPVFFFFLLFFELVFFCAATRASGCNQTCGSATVSYPFGFSDGCGIRLNCSAAGEMQLSGHRITVITHETIILDVQPVCDRSILAAEGLFRSHYAMTSSNTLFLRNCSSQRDFGCIISTEKISRRLNVTSCGLQGDDTICYSSRKTGGFLSWEEFSEATAGCAFMFASARYGGATFSKPSLVFGEAETGWWLNGECRCATNANCKRVDTPVSGGSTGFRCSCHEGFVGDGFADGAGCARVQNCRSLSSISGDCWSGSKVGAFLGGVLAAVSLMLGVAFFREYIRRLSTASRGKQITRRLLSQTSCTVATFSLKNVERATSNFAGTSVLGTGAYSTVYVGKLSNAGLVAIKRLKHDDVDLIINEIKLVSSVSHPNVVRLLGCCIESGEHILVYEFMPNGTLSQHLRRKRGDGLSWHARVSIAADVATAVAYLHTAVQPPIYHRDVKSSNILLDYDLRPKLADFGLATPAMVESSNASTVPQGTMGYVDPQCHCNFHLSDKCDVYSFGVVLVEIITAMKVVDFGRATSEVNLAALATDRIGKGMVEDIVDPFIKDDWDGRTRASVQEVAEVAFRCLAFYREARPSMAEVAEELERIRTEDCRSAVENATIVLEH